MGSTIKKRAKAGELTAGIFGWSGDNGDPDNFLSPLLASANAGNSNFARFKNAEFDALLDKAIGLTNKDERAALYKQAQVIFHDQAPMDSSCTLLLVSHHLALA